MLIFLISACLSAKKKDIIIEMDAHRFRESVVYHEPLDVWITMISSQDYDDHVSAYDTFEDAFKLGKGFLKFAYVDGMKNPRLNRKYKLDGKPAFIIFHAAGHTVVPANTTGRMLVNTASHYLPDLTKKVTNELGSDYDTPVCVLFTEKESVPPLWRAISYHFKNSITKICISSNKTLAEENNVTVFPTILMKNFTHKIQYEGDNEYGQLKNTITQFSNKRLKGMNRKLKVLPLRDFDRKCRGQDTVCIVHVYNTAVEELERLRRKHTTSMVQFFYGTGDLPFDFMEEGKVYAVNRDLGEYGVVDSIDDLSKAVNRILDGKFAWNKLEL